MALFQGKTGWDRLSVVQKKKIYRSDPFQQDLELRIPKKQQKNAKKLKSIIMASFQAKTGRDRLRVMPKKKNYHSDPFQPDSKQGFPKKQQKNAKN